MRGDDLLYLRAPSSPRITVRHQDKLGLAVAKLRSKRLSLLKPAKLLRRWPGQCNLVAILRLSWWAYRPVRRHGRSSTEPCSQDTVEMCKERTGWWVDMRPNIAHAVPRLGR